MRGFAILLSLMILTGCAPGRAGSHADKTAKHSAARIKILTYNIHHANPPSKPGMIDIAAVARVINNAKPDLVALQEIDVHTKRSGVTLHEADALAKETGLTAYFAKAIDYDGGEYGIAILSRFPIQK